MIEINGTKFSRHVGGGSYRHDYERIAIDIAGGILPEIPTYRKLIATDLFFVLYFVVKPYLEGQEHTCNNPFVVQACKEIEEGDRDYTLDVWARFHFKSSIITIAETIQWILTNPETSTAILAYAAKPAKKFLFSIRTIFEHDFLKHCYPDVVWENSEREAPMWSIDEGIVLRRKSNRPMPTVAAYGLIEGMPTGLHFERRVYDDIVTEDIKNSLDVMEAVKDKFDASQNLKTIEGSHHRVIGTFYHHNDPLTYVRDKTDTMTGKNKYAMRLKPATHNGAENGTPVLLSQTALDDLKSDRSFNTQQLCNPTPEGTQLLNPDYFKPIESEFIPKDCYKFMLVDQAGDLATNLKSGDSWAIGVLGVKPELTDIGASAVYLMDLFISPMSESEAIEQIVRMYLNAGVLQKLGVEKVGLSTTHIHIANALTARGRHVSEESGSLVLLRPAGREKTKKIESALAWPLNNNKLFYSTSISSVFIDKLKLEMKQFPYGHDDGIDMMSYLYDIIRDYHFAVWNVQKKYKQTEMGVV